MRILLRLASVIALLYYSISGWAQCGNNPPTLSTPTSFNIGLSSATLGASITGNGSGGGGCYITIKGVEWSTVSGGPYTQEEITESGTGSFSIDVTGLPAATQIFFRAYARNSDNGSPVGTTSEASFYTLATEPTSHAASLTATAISNNEITLQFPPASDIANAQGYVILMDDGQDPNTNNLDDGNNPNGANDYFEVVDNTATSFNATGLDGNTEYRFAIIPYNYAGHSGTYNYLTTAGYIIATATTAGDVNVNAITGGLAPIHPTPLNSATTDRALVGFELDASGNISFEGVVIHVTSTGSGQFSNFRLCKSTNSTFDNIGVDPPMAGVTITPSATAITISLSEPLTAGDHRYFLVADVDPGVNNTTPQVTLSYDENDFTFSPAYLSGTGSQSRTYSFNDVTRPLLISTIPAHNATGVDFNIDKLVMTFNENVDNIDTDAAQGITIHDAITDVAVVTIPRNALTADGTSAIVEVPITPGLLQPNRSYYVKAGNAVVEDVPADNDWLGITDETTWNFTTSGVIVNNLNSVICGGSFQPIADIVISEVAPGDFISSGTLNLEFADADFAFDVSTVTISAGPPGNTDITSISLNPKTLTRLTLNYTLDGTNDKTDVITISGLKIYTSGPGATTIVSGGGANAIWAIQEPVTFATVNAGASIPSAPTLATLPDDLKYCATNAPLNKTVAVQDDGGTFTWYADASSSTPLASGFEVDVESDLNINPSVIGTVKRYVVRIDGCRSEPLEVSFQVVPIPVSDAGPSATFSLCSGSSITLGGSPTLAGPSVSGTYQYLWSTNPPGNFVDLGSNPVVSPTSDKDTTYYYTVKIIDANGCASDITLPEATIAVEVDSTDQPIIYNSPLGTTFTLNSNPIELDATPSINSFYSGNGVYLSDGKYYFDPDLAGTAGSPHAISYTTELSNGCPKTEVRNFSVSTSSGSIVNLANSYCANETADPNKVLSLGPDWQANLDANNNFYLANYGWTYDFYDFQVYNSAGGVGTGVAGNTSTGQYIDPSQLQPYVNGANYTYVGMRVRRHVHKVVGPLGVVLVPESFDPPQFWQIQYVGFYTMPELKVSGIKAGQILCDLDENIELEANFSTGTFEISRDGTNWVSGPAVGMIDNPFNSGKGLLNSHNAYVSTGFPAPNNVPSVGITDFHIRYNYVVLGTTGSNNSACQTSTTIDFQISNNPLVTWTPFAKTEFCHEAPNLGISTVQSTGVAITGYGVFDNGDGTGSFDPDKGLEQKAFATNSPPYTDYNSPEDIAITATRTDGNGCRTTISQTVLVHPLFPASFTESDLALCYEDGPQDIIGAQPNAYFELSHANLNATFPQSTIDDFNLRTYFDQAVANGADGTVMQSFNLTFHTSDPDVQLGCANAVTKTFTINPPIQMDIGGMTSGLIVCDNGSALELTGNQPSAGSFEISTSPTTGFVNNALGLTNTSSGKAIYDPSGSGVAPGDPQKSLYIRYSFLGPGCVGSAEAIEELIVNPRPAITFSGSIPAANTAYCHEQGTSPTTILLSTVQNTNVSFSGFGITDNTNGTAIFNPTSAYQQSSLADNLNPLTDQSQRNIVITATRTDALNCVNTTTVSYIVNPLPTATFNPTQKEFCYEDDPVVLSGGQTNVSWQYIYRNTTSPANYSPGTVVQSTSTFDPQTLFDDATARGANSLATLQFDVIYTAINAMTGCTNKKDPVTFTVSPRIPVEIAGIENGEIFCSNIPDRELVFNPPNGTFRINGTTEPFSSGKYLFNPPLDGPSGGTDYTFTYTVITGNNCTNSQLKTVKVLPSPRALFQVQAQCDTALIPYHAETSINLPTATYTWNFSGEIKTGQDVEHRFPGVSTYYAKLKVEHPPYLVVSTNKELVCVDSLQQDQIVGPYPKDIRFEYFNICEGDDTNFEVTSSVPLNRVSWDFGDGESTNFGILSESITGLAKTSGSYQAPVHRFSDAYDELFVTVQGKTSDNFGGCPSIYRAKLSILKKWEASLSEPKYDMSALDNGKGFWVAEDRQGNATWEFATAAKQVIRTNEPAWVTGDTEPYKGNDVSYVNSPCFDLSAFSRPVISIQHWTDTETSDGAVMQYSIDGGETWSRLGDVATGLSWYNRPTISSNPGDQVGLSSGWSLSNQLAWAVGKHTLDVLPPLSRQKVRFRVAFSSFTNRDKRDGFAFNNVVIEERNRTILVENFTTLNPSEQPNNEEFKKLRANAELIFNPAELVKLQYHHSPAQNSSGPDELNRDNPTDQNARAAFYGVTNASRAFIDGGFGQRSELSNFLSPDLNLYFSLRTLVTSPVVINVDFDSEPKDRLNVRATVKARDNVGAPGQYNVFIAIAEQVVHTTQPVSEQVYVLRKFLPTAAGTPLTSLSASDAAQEINVSYDMRQVTRLTDGSFAPFAVIVFVQNLQTKDVLQTLMRQDGTASPNIITSIEDEDERYPRIYPNPADDVLNITLPSPVEVATPVKLFDSFGREVYADTFEAGEHTKTIETKGLSSGVYLIHLATPQGVVLKKAMVMHN